MSVICTKLKLVKITEKVHGLIISDNFSNFAQVSICVKNRHILTR